MLGQRQILLGHAVVGILDLAEMQERGASQREDEGVKVDRGERGDRGFRGYARRARSLRSVRRVGRRLIARARLFGERPSIGDREAPRWFRFATRHAGRLRTPG